MCTTVYPVCDAPHCHNCNSWSLRPITTIITTTIEPHNTHRSLARWAETHASHKIWCASYQHNKRASGAARQHSDAATGKLHAYIPRNILFRYNTPYTLTMSGPGRPASAGGLITVGRERMAVVAEGTSTSRNTAEQRWNSWNCLQPEEHHTFVQVGDNLVSFHRGNVFPVYFVNSGR